LLTSALLIVTFQRLHRLPTGVRIFYVREWWLRRRSPRLADRARSLGDL